MLFYLEMTIMRVLVVVVSDSDNPRPINLSQHLMVHLLSDVVGGCLALVRRSLPAVCVAGVAKLPARLP